MRDTIRRFLSAIAAERDRRAIRQCLDPIGDRYASQPLASAGLAISAGGSTLAKIGATDFYAVAKGVLVKVAAGTNMPALVGTITAAKFNVFCFFVDSAAVVTVAMGTEGAAIGNIAWPQFPEGKSLIGFLIVTYASTFTGGTTALDTATTVYVSPLGAFDPTVLIA